MDSFDENIHCEHHRIPRNCYLCYLHRNDNTEGKTILDTIHETLSQLKIRIDKIEQYKRLQDDSNRLVKECFSRFDEHRIKQIDENRAVSKHLDQHDEDVLYLIKEKIILEKRCDLIEEALTKLDGCIDKLDKENQIKEILEQHLDGSVTVKCVATGSIPKETLCMDKFIKPKTTGLTFEEAITAFKAGKSIRRSSWPKVDYVISRENFDSEANSYNDDDSLIGIDEILAMDWEIVK